MLIKELKNKFYNLDPFNKKDLISVLKTDRFSEQYKDIFKKEIDEKEGIIKWEERNSKIKKSNSLDGYIKKYGEEEGKKKME